MEGDIVAYLKLVFFSSLGQLCTPDAVPFMSWKQTEDWYFACVSFHTVHRVLKARILKWIAIPFSTGPCFVSSMTHPSWVALHGMVLRYNTER